MIIYRITNKINGKIYIGQTIGSIQKRWKEHRYFKRVSAISGAIKKYGEENFEIKTVVRCLNIDEMNHRETYYIKLYKSMYPVGYNLRSGGSNSQHSEKTKQLLRKANIGKKHKSETKMKMSISQRKRPKKYLSQSEIEYRRQKERERSKKRFIPKKTTNWVNPKAGIPSSHEVRTKNAISNGGKPFIVKDSTNNIVWQGIIISQCAREFNLSIGNISECLHGHRKQH